MRPIGLVTSAVGAVAARKLAQWSRAVADQRPSGPSLPAKRRDGHVRLKAAPPDRHARVAGGGTRARVENPISIAGVFRLKYCPTQEP